MSKQWKCIQILCIHPNVEWRKEYYFLNSNWKFIKEFISHYFVIQNSTSDTGTIISLTVPDFDSFLTTLKLRIFDGNIISYFQLPVKSAVIDKTIHSFLILTLFEPHAVSMASTDAIQRLTTGSGFWAWQAELPHRLGSSTRRERFARVIGWGKRPTIFKRHENAQSQNTGKRYNSAQM